MQPHQRHRQPPETPREQFRTPKRPSPRTTTSKSTTSKRTDSTSTPAPSLSRKRNSLSASRVQSTLTQIDFVTQNTQSDNEELDYLDTSVPREDAHNGEHAHIDDGSDDDAEYRLLQRTRLSSSRFEMNDDHPKRRRKGSIPNRQTPSHGIRKSQTPKPSASIKSKRKSSEKPAGKRDKTLTQMDFVRRYITIDDDDDVNMGYIQPTPARSAAQKETQESSSTTNDAKWTIPPPSAKRRRVFEEELDLSTGEPISQPVKPQDLKVEYAGQNGSNCVVPTTPQKNRRLEIPSSQSPESPGLAIITSSQFRSATRSPLRQKSSNMTSTVDKGIKEESPGGRETAGVSQGQLDASPKTPTPASSILLKPPHQGTPSLPPRAESCVPSTNFRAQEPQPEEQIRPVRTKSERAVIYETDAETDCSDSGDEEGNPVTPFRLHQPQLDVIQASPRSLDDSHELPLPAVQSSVDLDFGPASDGPMSDASIYYQRMQPATQFPHEPIPALNTQRLSELFPTEGNTQYIPPNAGSSLTKFRGPFLQTQTQSQDPDQTEMVPESSPAREQESNSIDQSDIVFQRPPVPESVQVESSQPGDRGNPRPHGMISRSQLLTSSVMESVPLPQFWMGSQDSVGEPYSLPDG